MPKKKVYLYIGGAAAVLLCAAFCFLVGKPLIEFASAPEEFRAFVDRSGILGRLIYIGMVIIQIIMAFLPGEPFEMVAGYAFGTLEGTLLCLLAESLGSILVVTLVRRFGTRLVYLFFSKEKVDKISFLRSSRKRIVLLTLLFTLPGTPKDLLCYFAGLTDIKLPILYIICTISRIPSVITSTLGGDMLGDRNYLFAIITFAATFLLSLLGLFIYNAITKRRENKKESS